MIYFDNAATSLPKPPAVGQAMLKSLDLFGGAGRGGHPAALEASRCIYRARKAAADLLGSAPERTVFTSNATESLNIAIQGLLTSSDHAVATALEHNSVLRPLYRLRSMGMGLSIVDADADGNLDYDGFRRSLRPNTKAVICTHASNLTGTLTDLDFVSAFCRENGLLLIVDAAQTAGALPIDADKMGIDVLCFTGHKGLMGPQGTGGLCVRWGLSIAPLKSGGSGLNSFSEAHPAELPESLEAGTPNAHGIAGLLSGIEYIRETGIHTILRRKLALSRRFREGVSDIPGLRIYGGGYGNDGSSHSHGYSHGHGSGSGGGHGDDGDGGHGDGHDGDGSHGDGSHGDGSHGDGHDGSGSHGHGHGDDGSGSHGDGGDHRFSASIVTLNIGSMDSGAVGDLLASRYGICVRCGTHCAPLAHLALGTKEQGAVRFSFSSFNTEDEIQAGIDALAEIARQHRG